MGIADDELNQVQHQAQLEEVAEREFRAWCGPALSIDFDRAVEMRNEYLANVQRTLAGTFASRRDALAAADWIKRNVDEVVVRWRVYVEARARFEETRCNPVLVAQELFNRGR
jgi:hypothetical protein